MQSVAAETSDRESALAFEKAIKEAWNSLDQGVEPVSALGQFSYEVTAPDLFTLCANWTHYENHLKSLCESITERQVCGTEPHVQELVYVSATLRLFNFHNYIWMPRINSSTPIDSFEDEKYEIYYKLLHHLTLSSLVNEDFLRTVMSHSGRGGRVAVHAYAQRELLGTQ